MFLEQLRLNWDRFSWFSNSNHVSSCRRNLKNQCVVILQTKLFCMRITDPSPVRIREIPLMYEHVQIKAYILVWRSRLCWRNHFCSYGEKCAFDDWMCLTKSFKFMNNWKLWFLLFLIAFIVHRKICYHLSLIKLHCRYRNRVCGKWCCFWNGFLLSTNYKKKYNQEFYLDKRKFIP
jgi:hypothetical protein